jgi:hypothetical protein
MTVWEYPTGRGMTSVSGTQPLAGVIVIVPMLQRVWAGWMAPAGLARTRVVAASVTIALMAAATATEIFRLRRA